MSEMGQWHTQIYISLHEIFQGSFWPMKYLKNYRHIWNISFEIFQCNITNPGGDWRGRDLSRFWSWGVAGRVVDGSWNIISYHVQEVHVCSKVVTFEEKWNNLDRSCCKWPIFAWKIELIFFLNCLKNRNFLESFAWKIDFFGTRIHDPLDFKSDWRRCIKNNNNEKHTQWA